MVAGQAFHSEISCHRFLYLTNNPHLFGQMLNRIIVASQYAMIPKILVAVDGSKASVEAVKFATRLAREYRRELVILRVVGEKKAVQELEENIRLQRLGEPPDESLIRLKLEEILSKLASSIQASGVRYEALAQVGDPKETILEVANRLGVEMIVLGFVGQKGVGKVRTLASVSRAIAEKSMIPILLVPQSHGKEPQPPALVR